MITKKKWKPEEIDDLCVAVYKLRLEDDCRGNTERMLAKDLAADPDDNGKKLRSRAQFYRPAVMATLKALDLVDSTPAKRREA